MSSVIRVLIVDDSAVMRQVLSGLLQPVSGIEVIGAVADPILAIARMKISWPDVIVLDVEMPRMDGITFLRKVMAERPTPVVICSTLTEKGAQTTMDAFAAGAVAVMTKPKIGLKQHVLDSAGEFVNAIRSAAQANMRRVVAKDPGRPQATLPTATKHTADVILAASGPAAMAQTDRKSVV